MNSVIRNRNGTMTIPLRIRLAAGSAAWLALCVLGTPAAAQTGTPFCFPGQGGVIACPCNNPPTAVGKGCDNFGAGPADSCELSATGTPFASPACTLVFDSTGENNTSTTIFMGSLSSSSSGLVFGAGVRCVTGSLKRLYTGSASGGAISRPSPGGPTVWARLSSVGIVPMAGTTTYHFTYYRDPLASGPCSNAFAAFNSSQALAILWQ